MKLWYTITLEGDDASALAEAVGELDEFVVNVGNSYDITVEVSTRPQPDDTLVNMIKTAISKAADTAEN